MSKLVKRIEWPAAIVLAVGIAAVAVAYVWGPAEHRADLVAAIGVAWGVVQSLLRALVASEAAK